MKKTSSKISKKLPLASCSLFMASPSSSQTLTLTLYHLDHDHIISILLLLPHDSILSFSLSCKKFNSLAFSDSLWELLCKRDWGQRKIEAFVATLSDKEREGLCYRKLYERICRVSSLTSKRLMFGGCEFPMARASHSLNLVSDWLILFGGGCEGGRHLDDTWAAYIGNRATSSLTWCHVNTGVPGGRFGHSCTLISDDSLILFGGIDDSGVRLNDTWHGRVVREGFGVRIEWKVLDVGGYKPPARGAHSACCIDNRAIIVHGGIGLYGLRLSDTWILDFSSEEGDSALTGSAGLNLTASWRQVGTGTRSATGPPARSGHTLTWIGGTRTVLFGGRSAGYEVLNDLWLFDFAGLRWKELRTDHNLFDEMPSPRVGHSATLTLGNEILIYGGEDSQRHRKDDFWLLDISTLLNYHSGTNIGTKNMWKKLSLEGLEGPGFRSFHGAAVGVAGRFLYVFGGMVDGFLQPSEVVGLRFDGELYEIGLGLNL